MVSKLLRLNPALYTTALVYLAVQVAFLSFLCSYYDYGLRNFTQWTLTQLYKFDYTREKIGWVKEVWKDVPKFDPGFSKKKIDHDKIETIDAEIHLGDTMQILNTEQLALFDGSRSSRPIYLAILGRVYNVDKGKKHYGVGGGYHFFAGRDATRAFVTGDFTEAGLIDDTSGLSHEDLLGIRDWVSFYEKDYKLVGVLVGRYYDINGNPTDELHNVLGRIQTAAEWRNSKAAEVEVFPPCNSEWHQSSGGRVWCTMKSGGIQRDWAGVPRLLYDPNTKQKRCACVKNFGVGLSSTGSVSNSRGDLDHPNLKTMTDTKIEDLRLPATIVSRIVDRAIGPSGTVSKEARTAIARAASVFILNVTSYANDYAVTRKRKVLAPEDVFQALSIIESDNITAPLMDALGAWKTNKANKSGEAKKRKAEKKNALTQGASNTSVPFSITLSEELRLKNAEHG